MNTKISELKICPKCGKEMLRRASSVTGQWESTPTEYYCIYDHTRFEQYPPNDATGCHSIVTFRDGGDF